MRAYASRSLRSARRIERITNQKIKPMSTVGASDQIAFAQKSSIAPPEYGAFLGFRHRAGRRSSRNRTTRRIPLERMTRRRAGSRRPLLSCHTPDLHLRLDPPALLLDGEPQQGLEPRLGPPVEAVLQATDAARHPLHQGLESCRG